MPETGSPESRVQGARKQLAIALEDTDDETTGTHLMVAIAATENALDALDATSEEVDA